MVGVREKNEPGKEKETEKGTFAKMKKGLTEGLRKGVKSIGKGTGLLILAGAIAGCGGGTVANDGETPTFPDGADGSQVTDVDAGVDAGPDQDLDAGIDAGPDVDLDAGVDAGPDVDLDAGVDADTDEEPLCLGVHNEEVSEVLIFDHTPLEIGGYSIALVGAPLNAALVDIKCISSGDDVALGVRLPVGQESVIEVPDDGKMIRIYVQGRCSHYVGVNVNVEDL
jgi:hypothetical protein